MKMHFVSSYEWCEAWADERDPNAGGASHKYEVRHYPPLAGGAYYTYAELSFQHGPRNVAGSTVGCLDDHVLAIEIDRMRAFQDGPFACDANAEALNHLEAAQRILRERAEERRARGVLGKNLA